MKKTILIGLLLAVFSTPGAAETVYVDGDARVNLRSGIGTRHPVIDILEPGQPLQITEKSENWVKIRLPDGREGWASSRLLTREKPAEITLSEFQQEYDQLSVTHESLQEENERLIVENQSLHEKLEETLAQMTQLRADHEALLSESSEFLTLKADHERLLEQFQDKTETVAALESALAAANRSFAIYCFLAGTGVLLLGMIIGAAMKRKRSKFI